MLIVEGPDGAGKTSLIERIAAETEWPIAEKAVSPDMSAQVPLTVWVQNAILRDRAGEKQVIYDRFCLISEQIYMPVTRVSPRDELSPMWFFEAWRQFIELRPTVVWCLPPMDAAWSNIEYDDTQPDVVKRNFAAIYWSYHFRWCTWAYGPNLRWDYTGVESPNDFDYLMRKVRGYVR